MYSASFGQLTSLRSRRGRAPAKRGDCCTFDQLRATSIRLAGLVQSSNTAVGAVAICFPANDAERIVAMLAAMQLGRPWEAYPRKPRLGGILGPSIVD